MYLIIRCFYVLRVKDKILFHSPNVLAVMFLQGKSGSERENYLGKKRISLGLL